MARTLLFSAMKNEGPFLLEWVAYHRVIGFDRIVVVSNDCEDGTDLMLDALASAGAVEHLRQKLRPGASAQRGAAVLVAGKGLPADGDRAIWLDADEFLNIHAGQGRVGDLVAAIGPARGILIPWRIFGDGGNAVFPGRHVSEDFTRASGPGFTPNREVKTLYRAGDGILGFAQRGINRPLIAADAQLTAADFVSARGEALRPDFEPTRDWLQGLDRGRTNLLHPDEFGWDLAQINHYTVRTPEFFALKRRRGRGWAGGAVNDRHTDAYYRNMNRNDEEDRSILRHAAAVDAEIARLMALPAVADAAAQIARLTAEMLRQAADEAAPPAAPAVLAEAAPPAGVEAPKLTLPAAEAALVREVYARSSAILEYGSGGSTVVAAEAGVADVLSVESDAAWAAMMERYFAACPPKGRVRIHHADIGPTKAWGRPQNERSFRNWPGYALSVWERPDFTAPEVVLIDGRFRLACFLTVLVLTKRDVTVLWDDYSNRPGYHAAERLLRPVSLTGRMARFEVTPKPFPPEHLPMLAQSYLAVD